MSDRAKDVDFHRARLLCVTAWVLSASVLCRGVLAVEATDDALARQILDATGVKGGLIVHVGCGDGRLTAALRANDDSFLVHGLDANAYNVQQAREHIEAARLYGTVSIDRAAGAQLPYIDNLVNLVVAEDPGQVDLDEMMRVLVPNGVAYVKTNGGWTKTVKPSPAEIDQWTHYLHDPSGNAVSQDTVVGPPRRYQWIGSPRWSRHHDHMSSTSAVVTAGGRIFQIFDEAPRESIVVPSEWSLIARDAFNGTILWKRPIPRWHTRFWPLKSGPAQLPRRLVAIGDTVYVTLGIDAPLTALDAATGQTIRTYEGTRMTEEILAADGVLYLLVDEDAEYPGGWNTDQPTVGEIKAQARDEHWSEHERSILAVRAESGEVLWKKQYGILPLTLTVDDSRVLFHDGEKLVCLDRADGDQKWSSKPVPRRSAFQGFFAPTVVSYNGVVLFSGGSVELDDTSGHINDMVALAAETGEVLWTAKHPPSGYKSPEDVLVAGGLVWFGETMSGSSLGEMTGRDPWTGGWSRSSSLSRSGRFMVRCSCKTVLSTAWPDGRCSSTAGCGCSSSIRRRARSWPRSFWTKEPPDGQQPAGYGQVAQHVDGAARYPVE